MEALDTPRGNRLVAHARVELGEPQVVGDLQPLEARARVADLHAGGIEREIEGGRGHAPASLKRRGLDRLRRKHRDLATREIHGGEALARDRLDAMIAAEEK